MSKVKIEVYSNADIKNYQDCSMARARICNSIPRSYSIDCIKRNCETTNFWAPFTDDGVKILYIGESPPASGEFIYDSKSSPGWFSNQRIIPDLKDRLKVAIFHKQYSDKTVLLQDMQNYGVLVIDCCKCAIDEISRLTVRNCVACHCYSKNTFHLIERIMDEHNPLIRFAFPRGKGRPMYQYLSDKYSSRVEDIRKSIVADKK